MNNTIQHNKSLLGHFATIVASLTPFVKCFALAAAITLITGCSDDIQSSNPLNEEQREPQTITATIDQPTEASDASSASNASVDTKTYLNTEDMTSYWKTGDQIGLTAIPASGDHVVNKPYTLNTGNGLKSATFIEETQTPVTT